MKPKILLLFFLFSIFFLTSFTYPHKFYTSITQINYNDKTQSYEIVMNVFWDDWEKALSEVQQREVRIDKPGIEKFSEEYLNAHFVMKYKEKRLGYKFVGLEQEKDIIRMYMELPHKYLEKGLFIKNDCLIAEFEGQINILNFQYLQNKKTLIFKEPNQFQEIK